MRILYDNFADDGTITANTPAVTNYPLTNMQDERLSTRFRTSTTTRIAIDLGSALTPTVFAIAGHNLSSAAVVRFSGSESVYATWSSGIILAFVGGTSYTSQLITESGNNITTEAGDYLTTDTLQLITESGNNITTEAGDYLTTENNPETARYCYIEISDPANADGYLELGRLWIGDYIPVTPSSFNDFTVTKKRSDRIAYGKGRKKYGLTGVTWRQINLRFPQTSHAVIDKLRNMALFSGSCHNIIFCNFDEIRSYPIVEPMYCSITEPLQFTHSDRMRFGYSLTMEENK